MTIVLRALVFLIFAGMAVSVARRRGISANHLTNLTNSNPWLRPIVALIACHVLAYMYLRVPYVWIAGYSLFWAIQAIIAVVYIAMRETVGTGNNTRSQLSGSGKAILVFLIPLTILFVAVELAKNDAYNDRQREQEAAAVQAAKPKPAGVILAKDLVLPHGPDEEAVRAFWHSSPLTPYQQETMIAVCGFESGFRQLNLDGSPHHGEINPEDIGVCQINRHDFGALASEHGFNIDTLQGNLDMALWIVQNRSIKRWVAATKARHYVLTQGITLVAPVGRYGDVIETQDISCHGSADRMVKVRDYLGTPHDLGPGVEPTFQSTTLEYMSTSEPAGKVDIICK